jgi:hypothetical protein
MDSGGLKYDKKAPHSDSCNLRVHLNSCSDCDGNTMSRVTEMIDVDLMIGRTLIDGKIVAEFKCETCDKCQRIEILDRAGYQRDVSGEPILWFCGQCRK